MLAVAPTNEPIRSRPCRRTEVDLLWVARKLGLLNCSQRTIIAKVRLLAGQQVHPFPLPKNPRFVKGERKTGAEAIDARSIWDRDAAERWFEDDLPPAESAALTNLRRSFVGQEMSKRAASLVLVA